jgi:hypothetical protein
MPGKNSPAKWSPYETKYYNKHQNSISTLTCGPTGHKVKRSLPVATKQVSMDYGLRYETGLTQQS